jgi:hypothetical protein
VNLKINPFVPQLNARCDLLNAGAEQNLKDCITAAIIHHWQQ